MGFVRSGIADDFLSQLLHLSLSPQPAIDFRVFENRNVRIAANLMKRFPPAKNSVVAQREAKQIHSEIPERIAYAID